MQELIEELNKITTGRIEYADAKSWTWFNIGGSPFFMYYPTSVNDIKILLQKLPKEVKYRTFGAGSNILVRDGGYEGIFIRLTKNFRKCEIVGNQIIADAGMLGKTITSIALEHELGGIEFLATIPGSLGGLIKMNAGAHGQAIQNVIEWVEFLDEYGTINRISNKNCGFQYRKSIFQNNWIILKACINCNKESKKNIQQKILKITEYRKKTQPIFGKMAGCFFKNPENIQAWQLIKNAKITMQNVEASDIHANFIINKKNATAFEVEYFVKMLQSNILFSNQIWLQTEVEIIGHY